MEDLQKVYEILQADIKTLQLKLSWLSSHRIEGVSGTIKTIRYEGALIALQQFSTEIKLVIDNHKVKKIDRRKTDRRGQRVLKDALPKLPKQIIKP